MNPITYTCNRCEKDYEAYDFGALCPDCEKLIDSVKCGGCDFLLDEGYDYTYCGLHKCSKMDLSFDQIKTCKKYKISRR